MRTQRLLAVLAVASLVAAVGCFAMAWRSAGDRHVDLAVSRDPAGSVGPLRAAGSTWPDAPVEVVIPAIGLSARVVPVGVDWAGRMRLPDPSRVGWCQLGPTPGPAVLVGRVDSRPGPAGVSRPSR